jgi:hypothetical protein
MCIRDEHLTDTTITPPVEQHASGAKSSPVHQGPPSLLAQIGHFVWHFVQMCLACCIGGFTLCFLFFGGAALIGYPDLIHQFPELSTLVIAFFLALPMAPGCVFVGWSGVPPWRWRPHQSFWGSC